MLTVNQSWKFHSYRKASPKKAEESEEEEEEDDDDEEDEEEEEDDDDDEEEDEEEGEGVTTLEVTTSVSSPSCCLIWWFPNAYNIVSVLHVWWLWGPEILSVLNLGVVLLWCCFSIGQNFTLMGHQLSVVKRDRILITAEIS